MSIVIDDIKALSNKTVVDTSNNRYKLTKDLERIIHSPEFKILGFLNDYMYCSDGLYLSKCTIDGEEIAQIKVEIEHATFCKKSKIFYGFGGKVLYQIDENLNIIWSKEFETDITNITMDPEGTVYVLFKDICVLRKVLVDKSEVFYINGSDDATSTVRLHCMTLSKGYGWLYIVRTNYNKGSYIDKYNIKTGEIVETVCIRKIIGSANITDRDYSFSDIFIQDDYVYVYCNSHIFKTNIKAGVEYWRFYSTTNNLSYNVGHIEFTDNPFTEYLYYYAGFSTWPTYNFGKISTNGKLIWALRIGNNDSNYTNFKLCTYKKKIYTIDKDIVDSLKEYVLSLNDNQLLFKTQNGNLIKVYKYNNEEIYDPVNYYTYRLIGDKIKDNVNKIVDYPLLHDNGNIITEDNYALLVETENDDYNNPENYEYFYLLASNYTIDLSDISILKDKTGKNLFTKLANVLKTKEPYNPSPTEEYITDYKGNKVDTIDNSDLIRSRLLYSVDKYLLADRHKYSNNIITKVLGNIIITKKNGHRLIKKVRSVYKYILSRYDDINIVQKWLEENGVTESTLPKYVDELRHHTLGMINNIQIAGVPTVYDIQPTQVYRYTFEGNEYPIREWGTLVFSCLNLPFTKHECIHRPYIDSLINMIEEKELRPVIFFINGKAIPWSKCTIIRDWSYNYLMISDIDIEDSTRLDCIIIPNSVKYGEDNKVLPKEDRITNFLFDAEGKITQDIDKVTMRVEIVDPNIVGEHKYYTDNNYIEVPNKYTQVASEQNIIIFENGLLNPNGKYYMTNHGRDIFTYKTGEDNSNVEYKTFYWIKANDYYGSLYKIPNWPLVTDYCIDDALDKTHHNEIDNFNTPFDFKMYREKTYSENVAQAVEYIMNYNMFLLIDYYKDEVNVRSYVYTGAQLIEKVPQDGGWLVVPRARKSGYDDYVMVFKNRTLYEYYDQIERDARIFKIPIFNHVDRNDIIEIIHFTKVDNSYYTLTVNDEMDYLPEKLRYDNFLLFANTPIDYPKYLDFDVENSRQYRVFFDYKNNFNENGKYIGTNIKLDSPYYENKTLNLCSKNQFHYMYYNIFEDKTYVNLAPQFRFCQSMYNYMIFKNGIRVDETKLSLTTPDMDSKYIQIGFSETLHEGDRLDIFYLPYKCTVYSATRDMISKDYQTAGCSISVDLSSMKCGVPLDKDLYMVFVNNNKINYGYIDNISSDNMYIDIDKMVESELGTTHTDLDVTRQRAKIINELFNPYQCTVTLIRFYDEEELLNKIISYSDLWSSSVKKLSSSDYAKLLAYKK